MAKWKRVQRPKQYRVPKSKMAFIKRPAKYGNKVTKLCFNDQCDNLFVGSPQSIWCEKCRPNSGRIKKRMEANGIYTPVELKRKAKKESN